MEWQASPSRLTRPTDQRSSGARVISAHLKGDGIAAISDCTSACQPA